MIREFRLFQDLGHVVDLIDRAFGAEIAEDRLTRRDVVLLRTFSPLLWLLSFVAPAARDAFAGVVWVEGGRIIGNATISRLMGDPERWLIGNVAVDRDARRRGIGRQLTLAAIKEITRRGGRIALLDVRADNFPAYELYRDLGFEPVDSTLELRRAPLVAPPFQPPPTPRRLRTAEWRKLWWLLRESTPMALQLFAPVRESQAFMMATASALGVAGRLLAGSQTELLVVNVGGEFLGAAEIEFHDGGTPHRIRLIVHPRGRGSVEAPLVAAALRRCASRSTALRAEVRASETAARAAFEASGFTLTRTLDRLAREV